MAQYNAPAQAQQDYRARCRSQHRQAQIQAQRTGAQFQTGALSAWPALLSPAVLLRNSDDAWSQTTLVSISGGCGKLAEELMAVVTRLVRSLGRRDAMHLVGSVLAAAGFSGLDGEEYTRLAYAVDSPRRVDAQVVQNLATMLAYCKRLEDKLGPCQVLDTVVARHRLVHRLLDHGCPNQLCKPLSLVDSTMAGAIGGYLVNRLKAFAEQMAAAAYTLDGQYGPAMTAYDRAHHFLTNANGNSPEPPAYWVHHGSIDSGRGRLLSRLDRTEEALNAATTALAQYDPTYVGRYTLCQVRLGYALILSKGITQAAHVLGDAAAQAHLYPRLTAELHTTRVDATLGKYRGS